MAFQYLVDSLNGNPNPDLRFISGQSMWTDLSKWRHTAIT